jgi:hypothetical protein
MRECAGAQEALHRVVKELTIKSKASVDLLDNCH